MTTAGEKFAAMNARMTFNKSGRVSAHATMSSESRSRPPVPDLLRVFDWAERFELLDCIGSGAMGQVWRARERDSEKIVALKMLDPARVGDEQTLARLDIEAATLMKLREAGAHANVVPILDFKLTESQACLVMEFIPGLNLKKWCEAHRLGLRERVNLIAQVARASGWFHAQGIVHRDLKPANILVNAVTHQPVIVDFSIAKLDDSLPITLTNEALGTAPYMAPEQIDRSRGGITPATDVYALGATLYELLTQVHPHPGDLTQVVQRHSDEVRPAPPSALNPEVPRDLECICLKTLSHRPGDRYPDGTALADDLDRFLAGEPVKARPLPHLTRLVRQARRKPALTAALAACLVLGAFALWNLRRQMAQRERFTLQTQLTTAMQHGTWSIESLDKSEAALTELTRYSAALAEAVRQRFHDDIVRDMEARLQQNHLLDEDFAWLRTTVAWLGARAPAQAGRLQSLITERLGRWETQAELRGPFADLHGLFPKSQVEVKDGLLHPVYEAPAGKTPAILVTNTIMVPVEVVCTFVAGKAAFHHIAMEVSHGNSRATLALYQTRNAPRKVLESLGMEKPDPQSHVLYIEHKRDFKHAIHIPDTHLLDQPFRMTLRLERERAEADINGRWRLRMDSPFSLGSVEATNYFRISWPKEIGLKELILRTRRSDAASPLEQADLLAADAQWTEARHLYENLRGDPIYGTEAEYKIAECLLREARSSEAMVIWDRLIQGPPSRWRNRSLIQMWVQTAIRGTGAKARPYLALLPDPLPAEMFEQIDPALLDDFEAVYASVGMGVALPRVNAAEIIEAAKAYRLLKMPPVQAASRFAMALHLVRLETAAFSLFDDGLEDPVACAADPGDLLAGINCLDQWCRIVASEQDSRLAGNLEFWQRKLAGEPTVQAVCQMEQARRSARAGDLRGAIAHIRASRQSTTVKLDNRVHTSIWLLEGMLYRMQGAEDKAQEAWRKALEVASTVTLKHPLHLCDSVLLHSLARSWDLRSATSVLTTLAGRHLRGKERTTAQAAFNAVFLADPAWLATFNAVLQDERGQKFAEEYVLCRDSPRELVQRFYRRLFEHYFLITAFPQATAEQSTRVRHIVDQFVNEMAMNPRGEIADLYAYLRAWNDRAAAPTLFQRDYPYSPELIENMKWLLSMRQRQWIVKSGE